MSNLVPEKRVDRNGKLVTRHIRSFRERIASVLIPKVSLSPPLASDHDEPTSDRDVRFELLMKRFEQCVESAVATKQKEADARILEMQTKLSQPQYSADERVREALRREISAADIMVPELRQDFEYARKDCKSLPLESVNTVLASFTDDKEKYPLEILKVILIRDEVERRETALYRDLVRNKDLSFDVPTILADVRDAMSMDDLSAVELGSREHQNVRNTVEIAVFIKKLRFESIGGTGASSMSVYDEYEAMKGELSMTSGLVTVIADFPDKLELVKKYVRERVTDYRASAVDVSVLHAYLSTPAQSLTDGVL